MNNYPQISIIIPVYNRAHLVHETLNSIINQTFTNWECIVVDDGSTDKSIEVLKEFSLKDNRIKYYKRPNSKPKGANACRNYGFELSNGEFINWFDSDDLMMPQKLESQVKQLADSNLQFIVCQTLVFQNTKENILGLRKERIYSEDFFNDFITNDIKWLTQAPLIKRQFIIDNDLSFDESLHQSQERDFFIKVLSKVDNYLYDNEPLVLFRKHNKSISFGKYSVLKEKSNFNVQYNILKNYQEKLSRKSRKILVKTLKRSLKNAIRNNEKKLYIEFNTLINYKIVNLSIYEKFKIKLGFYSIKYFNKGDCFFS